MIFYKSIVTGSLHLEKNMLVSAIFPYLQKQMAQYLHDNRTKTKVYYCCAKQ